MNEQLHIVCLDAPSPPDYGGAIDMYWKIRALADAGKKIILHYFNYREGRNVKGLEPYCSAVHAYPRKPPISSLPFFTPYIIGSRINQELADRLNADEYPILLEGIHCTGILRMLKKPARAIVRIHNNEARYYKTLAQAESNTLKKAYFRREAKLLDEWQDQLPKDQLLACLSLDDISTFKKTYQYSHLHFIPCFIPWQEVRGLTGKGRFCLYHGNLAVSENAAAAAWLVRHVFSKTDIPFIIAGKGIPASLFRLARGMKHIQFVNDPSIEALGQLVRDAHIHVLPSVNATGVKLKLLHALLEGRFCITNGNGLSGSGMEGAVPAAELPGEWYRYVEATMPKEFDEAEKEKRKQILSLYNNAANAAKLNALWTHYR